VPTISGHFWETGTIAGPVTLGAAEPDQFVVCSTYVYLTARVNGAAIDLPNHTYQWEQISPTGAGNWVQWVPSAGNTTPNIASSITQTVETIPDPSSIALGSPMAASSSLNGGTTIYAKVVALDASGGHTLPSAEASYTVNSVLSGGAPLSAGTTTLYVTYSAPSNSIWVTNYGTN